jgi:hypothetical protein
MMVMQIAWYIELFLWFLLALCLISVLEQFFT